MKTAVLLLVTALAAGCARNRHAVVIHTGTAIGIQLAENPITQVYEFKAGFARHGVAYIPSNRSNTDSPSSGASDTADVIMELRHGRFLSREAPFYLRLAVGKNAVSQPAAASMFAKDSEGTPKP